ncbi:glycoside hydrolase family 2 protein [Myceligenerans pegani]|uniref:beta-mannosidase n=1 Tax=Myceligenerans pegani TaxID=2776917 RepID=A0ABR9MWZ9_9MICO|nr:glycoside hydrolase family 2 protein [Myceligenerans sp. TRM 65318]MBE1875923.1 glycoside hydrolase family 2 protein [Myceligenerans sp. TRM 65318]MBE3018194.1 glycoside hydrolase family 2 protein [Myceligenerans sp. TRM 65318]
MTQTSTDSNEPAGATPAGVSRGGRIARRVRDLHDGWTLRYAGGPAPAELLAGALAPDGRGVPAAVPGTVHTDLMAAGLVPDPYVDDNERLLAWIGRCDWEYRTVFPWRPDGGAPADRHDLVLEGLDTVSVITLNGTEVGRTANQHRTYRFDVTDVLRDGDNELVVRFDSPVRYADAQSLALGQRPQVNHHPFNAIRKAACNFGWDWGIDAATAGIWRPVRLESWSVARLAAVRPLATADLSGPAPAGVLDVHLDIEHVDIEQATAPAPGLEASVVVRGPGGGALPGGSGTVAIEPGQTSAVVHLRPDDVALWWPRGYGDQPLYDVEVTLTAARPPSDTSGGDIPPVSDASSGIVEGAGTEPDAARPLDRWRGRTGFRTVALDMTPDDDGTPFTIVVNGRPVWVKGANWIPDDVFFHRVDRARYARRLDQAEFANLNLLRVWGGGLYESDDFYAECDERGLLVWQDFAFACAAYSEEEPLRGEVEAEARDAVTRLAPHPSLALWNGSNENIWGYHDWGWKLRLDGRTWGLGYYTDLLPRVVGELDGTRPYTPSSPWSGSLDRHPNDPEHGSMHSWELWNQLDWPHYRDTVPRFMAEFGWQAPPTWTTLRRSVGDTPLTPESPGMQVHQKAMEGNKKLTAGLVPHVPLPDDMEDWHWAMQWNQATAVRTAVEHLRSWAPRCTGSVVWQLNDCWPVTSWAAVDGDERPKPLLYALAHAHADRLVTVQPRPAGAGDVADGGGRGADVGGLDVGGADVGNGGAGAATVPAGHHGPAGARAGLAAVVVNDRDEPWDGGLVVRRLAYDGTELAAAKSSFAAAPRGAVTVPIPADVATPGDAGSELIVASVDGVRGTWFFAEPRDSALAPPDLDARVEPAGEGRVVVRVTARNLVRDLTLLADKAHPGAVADRALITLLPGETTTFGVRVGASGAAALAGVGGSAEADGLGSAEVTALPDAGGAAAALPDAAVLTAPRVLRSLNQLVGAP